MCQASAHVVISCCQPLKGEQEPGACSTHWQRMGTSLCLDSAVPAARSQNHMAEPEKLQGSFFLWLQQRTGRLQPQTRMALSSFPQE